MNSPNGVVKFQIEIPQAVYNELEVFIKKTIAESLEAHVTKIQSVEPRLTRAEAAKQLRVSLPTLDAHIAAGRISADRVGRRVIIRRSAIDSFIQQKNPGGRPG